MRILFLVRSLDVGGAERQIVALARGLQRRGHAVDIAVFYLGGLFEADLRSSGIAVHDLRKRGRWDTLRFTARLAALVRSLRPDVVHAYMEANVFASALKPLTGVKVAWGIRTAKVDLRHYDRFEQLYPLLERLSSGLADAIVANSSAARRRAIANRLPADKIVVVPNGIDCEEFRFDPEGRTRLRAKWGVPDDRVLVGVVGRLDPIKNHGNFLRAAALVAAARRDAHFVCIADTETRKGYRDKLLALAAELDLTDKLSWVNEGKVTRAVYSALDLAVLSSDPGESFPNVVGEAMACGRATVTTDSGDAALVVGNPRRVVPPQDHEALARCIRWVIDGVERHDPFATRSRITSTYSIEALAARTEQVLQELCSGTLHPGERA